MTGSDPQLERRVLDLFQVLLDLPEGDRVAWIDAHSEVDSPLRTRLMAMLAGDKLANLRTGGAGGMIVDERLPERIGAYRIIGLIGQGGMGTVYRGERMTGDFDHVAAIKVVRPGALSGALVERFQRERQTLASLSHPGIARLFDGGATEKGDPYIVMEYVDGVPLGTWNETAAATKAERTQLFLDICAAVSFAHQNLIVHRDITPSNILVAKDGTAKLIDFGIARPPVADVDAAPSAKKSLAGLSLTPGYAAPERVAGEAATTLSDVYSLGVLLDRMLAKDADLSAVVAKASANDPADRYASVDALADDVRAWRDGGVVEARNGGKRYAIGKFIGRHTLGVAVAFGTLLLLTGSLAVTLVSYTAAEKARAAEARRFGQLRSLSGFMLFDLNDRLRKVPGNTAARASLASEAQKYLSVLAASPSSDAALRLETANGLIELARIQGSPLEPNLALVKNTIANLKRAETLLAGLDPSAAKLPAVSAAITRAAAFRALIELHGESNAAESERYLGKAGAALENVPAAQRDEHWFEARRLYRWARLEFFNVEERVPAMLAEANALEREIAEWSADPATGMALDAVFDRALVAYFRGFAEYTAKKGDSGTSQFLRANRLFAAVEAKRRDDPAILYLIGWSSFTGASGAATVGQQAVSSALAIKANDIATRLLKLDPLDDASVVLARNAAETLAQDLANRRQYSQAISAQRDVIAKEKARLIQHGGGLGYNLALSEAILGTIGKAAGDRALACANWASAEARFTRVEKMGKLMAYQKEWLGQLRKNGAGCRSGTALASLEDVR